MKNFLRTVWDYNLFVAALLGTLAAGSLAMGGQHGWSNVLLAVIAGLELIPLLWEMIWKLRNGEYGVDILAATAIISSVLLKQYWAAIVIVLMLTGGRALEDYAEKRAHGELASLLDNAPQQAHVLRGRKEVDIAASQVHPGDKIVIRPGELVPVDAVITEGTASFDESSLTGESLPQPHDSGDAIMSGSVNLDGSITAKATAAAEDSQYQRIVQLVKGAQASQAPFVRLADRYAVPFTLVSFGIAIAAWIVTGQALRFLEVIVVATPCPLILAAPIAIISGMSHAAKHGVIVKTGGALEKLAEARTVAFDKTGTLTEGRMRVERVTTYGTYRRTEVLSYAASLERHSNHVQAQAIVEKADAEHAKTAHIKQVQEIAGMGVVGAGSGKTIIVGRLALLEDRNVDFPKTFKASDHDQTTAFVAIGGQLAGAISFGDDIRAESKATLEYLRSTGVTNFMMITGDNARTAKAIAKKLGITTVVAEALPADKITAVHNAAHRPLVFVGDGVNDAPVLTASDVGIALGARGSAAASESADIVLMRDDISQVGVAMRIAQRTFSIASQSILTGIGLSVVFMLVFATGKFVPIYGAAIQELVDVVVIFNALRAHGEGKHHGQNL